MAHGNRTKRISGELISSSMTSPVTSAEQVWDYGLLDDENNPKTVEQLNCEFKQDITQLQQTLRNINTELSSKQNIIEDLDLIRNKASTAQLPATTLAGYGITDTYTKLEVDNLFSHQNYITVSTYSALPDIGSTNTIYRVSSWDGISTDVTKYAEYAWNDVSGRYMFLCVKSLISEVFDISVYNNTVYADLTSALGIGGINVPEPLRKGGMSVKFIQNSNNKYVQYRLMSDTFNTTPVNWQGVDDKPTAGSDNLVKSGGVANDIAFNSYLETEMSQGNNIDYYINLNGIWSWQQGGGHKIISVKPGEKYRVYAEDDSIALYLWLQSSDVSANNPASISNVDGSRHIVEIGCFSDGVVPSDAHYMYLHSNVSGTLAPKKVCRLQLITNEVNGLSKEVAENVNLAKNGVEIGFNEGIIASSTGVVILPSPDNITSEYIMGGNTIVVKAGYYIKRVGQYDLQTEVYTLYGNYSTEQRFVHLIDGYKYRVTIAHTDSSDISPNEDVLEPFTHSNFHYLNSIDNPSRFKSIIIGSNGNLIHSSTDRTLSVRICYENQLFIARYYLAGSLANRGVWIGDTQQGSNIRRISSSATAGWHSDIYRATSSDVGKYIFICGEHSNGRAVAVGYVSNGVEYITDTNTLSKGFLTTLHLDCGRKYFSVTNIKTMLLKASQSGYSIMSLYFSDNQGFRFGLDDMNITVNNTTYDLAVALGDGITTSSPQGDKSPDGTDKWLTQSDMDDIISYANSLGIEIMPAFDMPGHMGAILDSFPQFKYPNNDVDINLKDELSVNFALAIMAKYVTYFASRGCHYYNFCGDEVKYIATLYANDEMYYYNDFIEKASRIIMSEGMIPVAFNEGLYYGGVNNNTNTNIISSYWAHYTHYASVKEQASMGVRLINTNSSYYYVLGISGPTESQLNEFNIHKFAGNQYFYNPIGACFCIWCDKGDYHGADGGDTLTPIVLPLIEAFGITVSMQV